MQDHRHAAIMFTDIVGYTALMGSDEESAFKVLAKNREIHTIIIKKYNGVLIKELGDGMLISFELASQAVRCAIEIQDDCTRSSVPIRIGIHEGEVVLENDDIWGDIVNIAARLQEKAETGCINISESVYQNIKNKPGITTRHIGIKAFKNVDEPIKVYQVFSSNQNSGKIKDDPKKIVFSRRVLIPLGIIIATIATIIISRQFNIMEQFLGNDTNYDLEKSIAVLPFINMSSDSEQEYFSDGLTEEIILHLANIGDLSVISRTTVFQYKERLKNLATIGQELGVSYILEGSVRKDQEKIRITVQLINAITDKHVWAENYDRKLNKTLEVQSEVARDVAKVLGIKLSTPELARINRKSTYTYTSYDYYLKAVREDKEWTIEGASKALAYLDSAIQLDPEFSEAYSLYAWQYVNLATFGNLDARQALKKALPAIRKAVELDSLSSDAYLVYGAVNHYLEWDFEKASKNFERSMELNSWGEAPIFQCICAYVEFLLANNKLTETWALFEKINKIDPAFFMVFDYKSVLYLLNNEIDKALEIVKKRASYSQDDWLTYSTYGTIYYMAAKYDSATIYMEKALASRQVADYQILSWLGVSYYKVGKIKKSQLILDDLLLRHANGELNVMVPIAMIYNVMGNEDLALDWLDKAYEAREPYLLWIKIIHFQNLHDNSRYLELLNKIGLNSTKV